MVQTAIRRSLVLSSALTSLTALALAAMAASPAAAQAAPPTAAPSADGSGADLEEVVVTGSRIARDGFSAPTPLTVLSQSEIRAQSPTNNIADYVNQIPSIAGSARPGNSRLSISSGTAGINALNLRNLGTSRTLVLLDGRRSVGSTITGAVDVNDFPQALISSVEIVTGGASAAYGSDAVSGVVNFILDKKFTGFKGALEGGQTTYDDGKNYQGSLTGGFAFGGGRGHVLLNGEYAHRDGVYNIDRDWNLRGDRNILNPAYVAGNGQPQYLIVTHSGTSNVLPGGIINGSTLTTGGASSLLRGTYFGANGTVNQYAYGPITNSTNTVGGDWQVSDSNQRIGLEPSDTRRGFFGRASYELTDAIEVYAEASYNRHHTLSNAGPQTDATATLQADNAYLVNALGSARLAGLRSVSMGTSNLDLTYRKTENTRTVERYVVGASGAFQLFDRRFKWDAYAQRGVTDTSEYTRDTTNSARLALATDAVFAPAGNKLGVAAGTIVCRSSLTNATNGCVPLNRLGVGVASPEAIAYVTGDPHRTQRFQQDVVAANLTFDAFSLPAGPLSLATGIEHRREEVSGYVEPQYQSGWAVGNYLASFGHYSVTEAYLEALVPVIKGLDINGAVRATDYSTSGFVTTWKIGGTYSPIPDIKLRATRSRDIRAPNLAELFQAGASRTNYLNDPFNGNNQTLFLEISKGNLALKPEVANSTNVGVVLQPRFLPGLSASVDFYDIKLNGAIGPQTAQIILNRCYQGLTEYCAAFVRDPAASPTLIVNVQPFNFTQIHAQGLDFDLSYRKSLADIWDNVDGAVTLRGMATNYLKNYTDNGVDAPTDTVGQNNDVGTPSWLYRLSATYDSGPWTVTVVGRGVSGGTISNNYIVCTTGCPVSTIDNPTINSNHVNGAVYADLNVVRRFEAGPASGEVFVNVTNLFNRDPAIVPGSGASTNLTYYDYLGRSFRAGVRFAF